MDDIYYYNIVAKELKTGQINQGLWLKCLTEESGDDKSAKLKYVQYRIEQLKSKDKLDDYREKKRRQREELAKIPSISKKVRMIRLSLIFLSIVIFIFIISFVMK